MKSLKADRASTTDSVALVPIPEACLRLVVQGLAVALPDLALADDAFPPLHVARRTLSLLESGCPPQWAIPYNIVDLSRQLVVGSCGFKGQPVSGAVEIGYGVAPSCHRRGYATAAVRHCQAMAARSGSVREVFALVAPDNAASAMLLVRSGFSIGPALLDTDGESVVRWHWTCID